MGTIVNVGAIAVGGLGGMLLGKYLKPSTQELLMKINGVCVLFLAISGAMESMLHGSFSMMLIVSLAIGAIVGDWIDIEGWLERFGAWLKQKSGNAKNKLFMEGFVTTTLTVCIGAMAIVGAIQDGVFHDPSTLYAKSLLDFIIVFVLSASLGVGCVFSAIPVGLLQGTITVLSSFLVFLLADGALDNLSVVGNVLIFCVGVNLIWPKTIKVANLLPALLIALFL
ncbi:DUF554 domain-containing protein [uncultured Dubosiella sp.]|uniref:DUF554 domain-containing protein n=1 Tax=uncultured Dubosiella sp. TaxID=1937011 RepID=UPI0025B58CA8|nr:DUF554 domain-containing protein [uncultured Dubosiella sp.]